MTPADVTAYINNYYLNEVLFKNRYAAQPFNYMIRRSSYHSPEGGISIEQTTNNGVWPIATITRHDVVNMSFALNSATKVHFRGDRYVHGWLHHTFVPGSTKPTNGHQNIGLNIIATARQFSNYILLIGRILNNNEFQPEHGILVKDKDIVNIPLLLEMIANQKVFKKAIKTLSPTQQAFVTAYRNMQLQHTLFGLVTIQIKPQLEKLLNIRDDSLLKEISLTQDILDLIINYQIPLDVLSVDKLEVFAAPSANVAISIPDIEVVRNQVKAMKVIVFY